MNIGIDLHNTIDKFPDMFYSIMSSYISSGHTVYVISGPEKHIIKKELVKLTFDDIYTDVYSIIDFLRTEMNVDGWYVENNNKRYWYCDDNIWWSSKSLICQKYNIDMMIDDRIEYRKYFDISHKTRFILFNDNLTESIRNMNNICPINSLVYN